MSYLAVGIAFFIAAAVMPAVIWLAGKVGAVDAPNADVATHLSPTPLLGGISIIVGSLVGASVIGGINFSLISALGVSVLCLMGLYKDVTRLDMPPFLQILVQIICCLLILLGNPDQYWPWWQQMLAVFFGVALVNAINFLDVSDGLCGAVVIPIFIGLYGLGGSPVNLSFAAAVLGFMIWNKPKARVFMGDIGAFFVGATLFLLLTDDLLKGQLHPSALLLLAVPYGELGITILVRLVRGRSATQGDASHLSLVMLNAGWSPWAIIGLFGGITLVSVGLVAGVFV